MHVICYFKTKHDDDDDDDDDDDLCTESKHAA
jgi:hypothetical protein